MFTGLVQAIGTIESFEHGTESAVITIGVEGFLNDCKIGDSIAVNGVCLTVTSFSPSSFTVDVMIQTLKMTSMAQLDVGAKLNLELAARVSDRLGGHIVQGHVDGVGKVVGIQPGDKWQRMDITIPEKLMKYVQPQGSICIDGTSLTVGELNDSTHTITVWLIPETLKKTILGEFQVGTEVNIEVDVLAKYVERLLNRGEQ